MPHQDTFCFVDVICNFVIVGLNVYSMLKHETLVLTRSALERIEERLLFEMHSVNFREIPYRTIRRERNV